MKYPGRVGPVGASSSAREVPMEEGRGIGGACRFGNLMVHAREAAQTSDRPVGRVGPGRPGRPRMAALCSSAAASLSLHGPMRGYQVIVRVHAPR